MKHVFILTCILVSSISKADTDKALVEISDGLLRFVSRSVSPSSEKECLERSPEGLKALSFIDEASFLKYRKNRSGSKEEISEQEAHKLFKFLKDQPMMSHGSVEACSARAHLASLLLDLNGYSSQKLFLVSRRGRDFETTTVNGNAATWWYHVAPTLRVKTQSGALETWVFDPTTMTRPEPIDKWIKHITKDHCPSVNYPWKSIDWPTGCYFYQTTRFTFGVLKPVRKSWDLEEVQDALMMNAKETSLTVEAELKKLRAKTK